MPAAPTGPGNGGDELGPGDEIKVFKDEGEDENEQNASESLQAELLEEKSSLITESEQFHGGKLRRPETAGHPSFSVPGFPPPFGMGYLFNPYAAAAYANGGAALFPPFLSNHLRSPPPAHMASLPADKASMAPTAAFRPPMYPLAHQNPYSHLGMEQLAAWHRSQFPSASSGNLMSGFSPGSVGLFPSYPHLNFGQLPPDTKQESGDRHTHTDKANQSPKKQEPHIKKPLNAFMLYMKEMRPVVQAECTLKESAAINQILGRRWHGLSKEEQAKYYERAKQERQTHMEMYPHWNARDNYKYGQKKKKRKKDKSEDPAANMKKCRARYGLEQQNLWCKPCRRKKKCIRVEMYLAGRTEQEIEATTFDEQGEAITPIGMESSNSHGSHGSSHGSGGEGGSPAGSVESFGQFPNTPEGGMSVTSVGSPASLMSPTTPGEGSDCWPPSYPPPSHHQPRHPPVGSDPRDTNNPLSISSLTSRNLSSP